MLIRFPQLCYFSVLCSVLLLTTPVKADDPAKSPEAIPGTTKVDAEGVIDLVTRVSNLVMVDARITADRKQGYIEGSVSLPDIDTDCDSLSRVIPEKSAPVLFYCNGVKCGRSVKSVRVALQCGYNNIYWYRGGFEDWQNKGYPYIKD